MPLSMLASMQAAQVWSHLLQRCRQHLVYVTQDITPKQLPLLAGLKGLHQCSCHKCSQCCWVSRQLWWPRWQARLMTRRTAAGSRFSASAVTAARS